MAYRPKTPFNVPMRLLIPTTQNIKGVVKKVFPEPETAPLIFASFRTFGGTENTSNDMYTVFDTATIETWYRPDISADCRIFIEQNKKTYDIVGTPENIDMMNQFLQIKVEKVGGGA